MRLVLFATSLIVLTFVGYVAISGYFLANAIAGVLAANGTAASRAAAETITDPLVLGYRGNPTKALGLPFEAIAIETPLGPAEAWLVRATGPEIGTAIFVHGISGAREDGYRYLTMLQKAGWSVLMISYRNDVTAPADPNGRHALGLTEWPDLEAAVNYLVPGPDGPGVLVVADSMGAAILGQFLTRSDVADRVTAVALDSPALSFKSLVGNVSHQSGKPLASVSAWAAERILPLIASLPFNEAEVTNQYVEFVGPMFIAHGSSDGLVPIELSRSLAEARSGKTVSIWSKADHLGSFNEDQAAYSTAFANFLAGIDG